MVGVGKEEKEEGGQYRCLKDLSYCCGQMGLRLCGDLWEIVQNMPLSRSTQRTLRLG